jgi:hypothetical protein
MLLEDIMFSQKKLSRFGCRVLYLWLSLCALIARPSAAAQEGATGDAYKACLTAAEAGFTITRGLNPGSFSLWSPGEGFRVAQVEPGSSEPGRFEQNVAASRTLLEDVAKLQGIVPEQGTAGENFSTVTVNNGRADAHFIGISLLIDSSRRATSMWLWAPAVAYTKPGDLAAMQQTVWNRLRDCQSSR